MPRRVDEGGRRKEFKAERDGKRGRPLRLQRNKIIACMYIPSYLQNVDISYIPEVTTIEKTEHNAF